MKLIMTKTQAHRYILRCSQCHTDIADDGLVLFHQGCKKPGLLRTIYTASSPGSGDKSKGLFQYREWLPVRRILDGSSVTITYRSQELAKHLRLKNLFIAFSGYWPEMGASMRTCTFKEIEAYAACARLPDNFSDVLVVASAGNTARAFIRVCSEQNIRALIVVPERAIPMLWQEKDQNDCVHVIALGGNSDYLDAILLAEKICRINGFVPEGGASNVARRDGLGTAVLSCAAEAKRIPDEYFQAVGSGTGAIAAWEASIRLSNNQVWPGGPMRLHIAQNIPFTPISDSWALHSRKLISSDKPPLDSRAKPYASVLSNRKPPYGIAGGLYDALVATNGRAYGITNKEAIAASKLFESLEGIDIDPAAAVAVACLMKCATNKMVKNDAYIMLNISGGGYKRLQRDVSLQKTTAVTFISQYNDSPIDFILPRY